MCLRAVGEQVSQGVDSGAVPCMRCWCCLHAGSISFVGNIRHRCPVADSPEKRLDGGCRRLRREDVAFADGPSPPLSETHARRPLHALRPSASLGPGALAPLPLDRSTGVDFPMGLLEVCFYCGFLLWVLQGFGCRACLAGGTEWRLGYTTNLPIDLQGLGLGCRSM